MTENIKTVFLTISERGDVWFDELKVTEEQTLGQALRRRGFNRFLVWPGTQLDDPDAIRDRMHVRIRIRS